MAVLVYHGPPGSYKTTWAVYEGIVPAWKAGKRIYTNIRGITHERCLKALGDTGAELFSSPSDTEEELENWRRFFHFIEQDAILVIDEIQLLYPTTITKKDWSNFDYDGADEWRPRGVWEAFQKHRHYSWDMFVTCQNIGQIHPEIRKTIEGCWRHRNQATVGLKGFVLREYHEVDSRSVIRQEMPKAKSVGKQVWKLYDSTTTGKFSDTIVDASMFKSVKVWLLIAVISISLFFAVRGFLRMGEKHENTAPNTENIQGSALSSNRNSQNSPKDSHPVAGSLVTGKTGASVGSLNRPYAGYQVYLLSDAVRTVKPIFVTDKNGVTTTTDYIQLKATFVLVSQDLQEYLELDYEALKALGYRMTVDGRCAVRLYHGGLEPRYFIQHVGCYRSIDQRPAFTDFQYVLVGVSRIGNRHNYIFADTKDCTQRNGSYLLQHGFSIEPVDSRSVRVNGRYQPLTDCIIPVQVQQTFTPQPNQVSQVTNNVGLPTLPKDK